MRVIADLPPTLARAWVRLYTRGMPPELRELRLAEVAGDLHAHQQERRAHGVSPAVTTGEILARTLLGIPDDLGWRRDAMRARRAAVGDARRPTMAISTRGLQWMGLCALIGGLTWVGFNGLGFLTTGAFTDVWGIGSTLLCFLGVLGFYLQQRGGVGRVGSTGLLFLLAGFACSLIAAPLFAVFGERNVAGGMMAVLGWALLIPLGFLLIGFGVRIPYRGVMLAVGLLLVVRMALNSTFASILNTYYAGVATSLLWATGLTVIGYAMWSASRSAPARAVTS